VKEAPVEVRTFSADGRDADWTARGVTSRPTGSSFEVATPTGERLAVEVPLVGDFNVTNALCAIAVLSEAGFDPATVVRGIGATGGVPGRLEQLHEGQDFVAVVDYAHKPEAVEAALGALRPLTGGRLVVVLGAGGDRDPGKRILMGEVAARLADVVVVTDDNPRSEDPAEIRASLLAGARTVTPGSRAHLLEEGDRRRAIRAAVRMAGPGDTVVVAGKGHETGQEIAGTVHPFDDRVVLRAELAALSEAGVAGPRSPR
jgi:UDP-N-acetylmuramoyl-L-alanyl-D-glutamate--2,6-diaminopimelate ligase